MDKANRETENNRFLHEHGLSLVEIMVAMMIFMVVAAGVAGTLIAGLQGTVSARQSTMGKAEAQEQIEAMRGMVFYVPYSTDPDVGTTADIDLLDVYYPNTNTTHGTDSKGWTGWYTSSASDAYYTRESPADDRGIARVVETRFVNNEGDIIVPGSGYNSNTAGADSPPSNLVQVTVTTEWQDRGRDQNYTLETMISSVSQEVPAGEGGGGDESGCTHSSNTQATVTGGTFITSTGTSDPYTELVNGNLGSAYVNGSYGCTASIHAEGEGGEQVVVGGSTYTGAAADVTGPPDDSENNGPLTVGPPGAWPKPTISGSQAEAEVESDSASYELKAKSEIYVNSQTLQLQQVDGVPSGGGSCTDSCKRWDNINPALAITGNSYHPAEVELEQVDGVSTVTGKVRFQQANLFPLQKVTPNAANASQGLIFVRDFTITSTSTASGVAGGASNSLTYSATVGMFNTSKSSSCSGDACYDLYTISPSNPLQTAINLNDSNYKLQQAAITEWSSFTTADISSAMFASADGTVASVNVSDGLLKISMKYGSGYQLKNGSASWWTAQKGFQQLWLGAFDISVIQYE